MHYRHGRKEQPAACRLEKTPGGMGGGGGLQPNQEPSAAPASATDGGTQFLTVAHPLPHPLPPASLRKPPTLATPNPSCSLPLTIGIWLSGSPLCCSKKIAWFSWLKAPYPLSAQHAVSSSWMIPIVNAGVTIGQARDTPTLHETKAHATNGWAKTHTHLMKQCLEKEAAVTFLQPQ